MIKLKDLIKKNYEEVEEGFSTGNSADKNNTKNRSEKVGYKMVGEDDKSTFDLSNESDRGDAEFASGNLKSINLDEWTEKDEADSTIKRWSKPYGDKYTEYEKKKFGLKDENIKLPIEVGDTVLMGKFKNKKVVIKSIETNEKGDVLINGRPALKFRIIKKEVDEDVKSFNRKDKDGGEYRKYTPEEDSDIEQPYRPKKKLKKNKKIDEVGLKRRKIKKRRVVRPSQKTRLMRQGRRYYLGKQKAEKELAKSGLPGQVVSKKMGRQRMFFVSYKKPKNFWGTGRVLNKESGNIKLKDLILEASPPTIKFKDKSGNDGEVAFDTAIEYGTHPPAGYGQFQHPAYKQAIKMKPTKEPDKPEDGKLGTKQKPSDDKKSTSDDTNILKQQNNIAQKLTKKYGVDPKIKFVKNLSGNDYAHYNVDTNTIEISSDKNKDTKQFLISVLHEIDHARDAKKLGPENYKNQYSIGMELAQQKGGHFRDDNPYEKKAEKWAVQQYEKIKGSIDTKNMMTPPSDEVPEQEPEGPSDNVFGVERENPKFVFDKPRPDDNPVKPDGIPGNVNWDSMGGNARMEYLKSVTDIKMVDEKKKEKSRLPVGTVINSNIPDETIAHIFKNASDSTEDMNKSKLVELSGLSAMSGIDNNKIDVDVSMNTVGTLTEFSVSVKGYLGEDKESGVGYSMSRSIYVSSLKPSGQGGEIVIRNDSSNLDNLPKGTGTKMLVEQIRNGKRMGVSRVSCYAAGHERADMNGYYSWPRLGYDARNEKEFKEVKQASINRYLKELANQEADNNPNMNPDHIYKSIKKGTWMKNPIPDYITNAKNFKDIMSTTEGRKWWKHNGSGFEASIDLNSPGQIAYIEAYAKNKGLFSKDGEIINKKTKSKYRNIFMAIKDEAKETAQLSKTIMRWATGKKIGKSESRKAKEQFVDLLRMGGLAIPAAIPIVGKLTIPAIVKLGDKVGIRVLPKSFYKKSI